MTERPAIPNVNWADHPGVWVDYLRDDRAWLVHENDRLRQVILDARRNGSVPEAYWLQEPQTSPQPTKE